ncbi:Calcium-binding protein CBP-like protein [Drosera capensis]
MSGRGGSSSSSYQHNPPGFGYGYPGPPGNPYSQPLPQFYAPPPPSHSPHAPPPSPYAPPKPPHDSTTAYSTASSHAPRNQLNNPYTGSPPPPLQSATHSYHHSPSYSYPSGLGLFPAGTDADVIACFRAADKDGSGTIDDVELQRALSGYGQRFVGRTVRLLMYGFTGNPNVRRIGPKEFTPLFYSLQNWRASFERFDRDRSGRIDTNELREALLSLGFAVSPTILDLLISKFDKTGGRSNGIEYDNFIECCLTVKGLTEKFKAKDTTYSGSATFAYEEFMLTVLPFIIA